MFKQLVAIALLVGAGACGNDSAVGDDMPPPSGSVVYYGKVDKILNDNCVNCHSSDPDRLAPFPLATYADAVQAAKDQAVGSAINTRQMPPFFATNDGSCGDYTSSWLSDDELATLTAWFNGSQPEGDVANASPPPAAMAQLDHVDATLDAGADYLPPTDQGTDIYRCFIVDPGLTADKFLVGNFVHPTNNLIVHHVIVFSLPDAAAETAATKLDQADGDLGYTCFGGPGVDSAEFVTGWAPGQGAVMFPDTTGIRVLGGRKLIMQVHYNLANADGIADHTTIDLQFADSVQYEAKIGPLAALPQLPPGMPDVTSSSTRALPAAPLRLWGSAMHMHTRGTKADIQNMTNGSCVIDLQTWSFHWQNFYWEKTPVSLDPATKLQLTCHYDTSAETSEVHNGEKTTDEMCRAFLYLTQ